MKINKFGDDLMPDNVIDTFYNRIEKKLHCGHNVNDESIQNEIDRIILVNGKIPNKIITLLDSFK